MTAPSIQFNNNVGSDFYICPSSDSTSNSCINVPAALSKTKSSSVVISNYPNPLYICIAQPSGDELTLISTVTSNSDTVTSNSVETIKTIVTVADNQDINTVGSIMQILIVSQPTSIVSQPTSIVNQDPYDFVVNTNSFSYDTTKYEVVALTNNLVANYNVSTNQYDNNYLLILESDPDINYFQGGVFGPNCLVSYFENCSVPKTVDNKVNTKTKTCEKPKISLSNTCYVYLGQDYSIHYAPEFPLTLITALDSGMCLGTILSNGSSNPFQLPTVNDPMQEICVEFDIGGSLIPYPFPLITLPLGVLKPLCSGEFQLINHTSTDLYLSASQDSITNALKIPAYNDSNPTTYIPASYINPETFYVCSSNLTENACNLISTLTYLPEYFAGSADNPFGKLSINDNQNHTNSNPLFVVVSTFSEYENPNNPDHVLAQLQTIEIFQAVPSVGGAYQNMIQIINQISSTNSNPHGPDTSISVLSTVSSKGYQDYPDKGIGIFGENCQMNIDINYNVSFNTSPITDSCYLFSTGSNAISGCYFPIVSETNGCVGQITLSNGVFNASASSQCPYISDVDGFDSRKTDSAISIAVKGSTVIASDGT